MRVRVRVRIQPSACIYLNESEVNYSNCQNFLRNKLPEHTSELPLRHHREELPGTRAEHNPDAPILGYFISLPLPRHLVSSLSLSPSPAA